jgi:hypothetical protein
MAMGGDIDFILAGMLHLSFNPQGWRSSAQCNVALPESRDEAPISLQGSTAKDEEALSQSRCAMGLLKYNK